MREDGRFLIRQWLDGCVVFDRQVGDTHALDPTSAAIFLGIENGNVTMSGLAEKISSFHPDATSQDLRAKVYGVLAHLEKLGLVRADLN